MRGHGCKGLIDAPDNVLLGSLLASGGADGPRQVEDLGGQQRGQPLQPVYLGDGQEAAVLRSLRTVARDKTWNR